MLVALLCLCARIIRAVSRSSSPFFFPSFRIREHIIQEDSMCYSVVNFCAYFIACDAQQVVRHAARPSGSPPPPPCASRSVMYYYMFRAYSSLPILTSAIYYSSTDKPRQQEKSLQQHKSSSRVYCTKHAQKITTTTHYCRMYVPVKYSFHLYSSETTG